MDTQKLLSYMRQCIKKYNMIQNHDYIAVGLSGGKDSYTLLKGLTELKKFYPENYNLCAIYVDLAVENQTENINTMKNYCDMLNVPFYVVNTDIFSIVFEERKEKNPCALCAKMRKGALNQKALEIGCNKIAYAHHKDDFIETSLMSLFYEGHYYCFPPVTKLDKTGLTLIRPMFYISEREIQGYANRNSFPIIKNPCPADGKTTRETVKQYIKESEQTFPNIRKNLTTALTHYYEKEI